MDNVEKEGGVGELVRTKSKCINSGSPTFQMSHQDLTARRPGHAQQIPTPLDKSPVLIPPDQPFRPSPIVTSCPLWSSPLVYNSAIFYLYYTVQHHERQGYTGEQQLRRGISTPMDGEATQVEQDMAPIASDGSHISSSTVHPQPNSIGRACTWDSMPISA